MKEGKTKWPTKYWHNLFCSSCGAVNRILIGDTNVVIEGMDECFYCGAKIWWTTEEILRNEAQMAN